MSSRLARLRDRIHAAGERLQWLPSAVARLTLGWVFVQSGWGKLHNLPKVVDYFASLGVPAPRIQAPVAAFVEFACGALLLGGLLTRLASLPLLAIMGVAVLTAKSGDVHSLSDLFGVEEYLYIALLLWLGAYGGGPISLDRILWRRLDGGKAA